MHLSLPDSRTVLGLGSLILGLLVAVPATAAQEVVLENEDFQFVDADETTAFFRWSVDVVDGGGDGVRVRVILELLDEDDRVVNRDDRGRSADSATVTLEAGEGRRTLNQQGSIRYDVAADVTTWRIRWEIVEARVPRHK